MRALLKTFLLIPLAVVASCSSDPDKKTETTKTTKDTAVVVKETFPTGTVIAPSYSRIDPTQSYALYLPKTYDTKKAFPVIFIFDPHADGKLPVDKYKDLAEKYGFILVASNNSQNGMAYDQTSSIAVNMFTDIQNRLMIDNRSMYLMGFSGGARLANALTISNGNMAGVICCGASTPANNMNITRSNYIFLGIGGNADFNYTEMKKYDMMDLPSNNIKHTFISFDGKHEWPAVDVMEKGFLWLHLDRMRRQLIPKDDAMITAALKDATTKLNTLKNPYEIYEFCRSTIAFYEGLGDLTLFYDTYKKWNNSPEIDKQLKLNELGYQKEDQLKQFYMEAMQSKNAEWWNTEIAGMNKTIKSSKDKEQGLVQKRLLSFLSLACYMQANGLFNQRKFDASEYFCKLYIQVDPTNSEAHYIMAELKAIARKDDEAIKSLQESVKNGFKDVKRMQSDSAFSLIMAKPEFLKIEESIQK